MSFDLHSVPDRDVHDIVEAYLEEARELGFRYVAAHSRTRNWGARRWCGTMLARWNSSKHSGRSWRGWGLGRHCGYVEGFSGPLIPD